MIRRLLYLSGIAALFVVTNHSLGWGFTALFWWTHRYRAVVSPNFDQMYSLSYIVLRLLEQVVVVAVPAFLFISGFFIVLVMNRRADGSRADVIWQRIRMLVIPYLIWSVIMMAADVVQGRSLAPLEAARGLILGEAAPGFYFIPLLIQLYLLSPIILRWGRKNWQSLLVVSGLATLFVTLIRNLIILRLDLPGRQVLNLMVSGWFFPGSLFWFALGSVAGLHPESFRNLVAKRATLWRIMTVALIILGTIEWEYLLLGSGREWVRTVFTPLDAFYSFTFLLTFMGSCEKSYIFYDRFVSLGGKAYGVYLIHTIVLIMTARGIYHVAPYLLGAAPVFVLVLTLCGVIVPDLMMDVVKKSTAKRAYPILFG